MSYTPTNWKSGDVITSAKLNKLENGVAASGGGCLVLEISLETGALNKTWKEIYDACQQMVVLLPSMYEEAEGRMIFYLINAQKRTLISGTVCECHFCVPIIDDGSLTFTLVTFATDSENGYPVVVV